MRDRDLAQDRAWTRPVRAEPVVFVVKLAFLQAETAAADALVELVAGAGEQVDTLVDLVAHPSAYLLPVGQSWRTALRQLGELLLDLGKREAELLRDENEAHAANVRAQEAALVAARSERGDQSFGFVISKRGDRDPRARGELSDRYESVRQAPHPVVFV